MTRQLPFEGITTQSGINHAVCSRLVAKLFRVHSTQEESTPTQYIKAFLSLFECKMARACSFLLQQAPVVSASFRA
ncbi:hypothetical protein DUNSADRAFT_588 [Dunaliella salina]|uniref:Encoded protein n=1 Tax=Dunaliella salina TaxID=3046 RepID=A0ABQ7GY50_DUNSA|nr:hypothetical protein DUNSADRAFT_588 [Dunaliella salina]|eukprot:KAF5839517.1 hypothetical protein DUNSADRAFT_588 [Dunaliella salina]